MNTKVRFKLYKAGKPWMVMGIATASFVLVQGGLVQAATNVTPNVNSITQVKQTAPVARAATILESGQLGTASDAAKWDIDSQGVLTIHAGMFYAEGSRPAAWTYLGSMIKKIVIEPNVKVAAGAGNLTQYFSLLPHLTTVVGGNNLDVTNATSMYRLFWTDPSLQSVDVANWQTGHVTDMSFMFYDDSALQALDVANWDVGQVTAMRNMFYGDSNLATLDVTNWDVSQVTTLSGAFESTGIQKLNVANWQTSNMVDLDNAFRDMPVTTLDVSKWNTSKVTDFGWLFAEDYELAQLDASHFDISKGTYFWDMFRNDESLTSLDLSSFDTSNATDWNSDALAGLTSLEKITIGPEVVDFSTASLGNPAVDTSNPNNMNTGKWQQVDPILGGTETDPKGPTLLLKMMRVKRMGPLEKPLYLSS